METIEVEDLNTRIVLEAAAANNLAAAENAEAKAKLALLEIEGGGVDIETFRPLFEDSPLETLNIPEGITTIANRAFMDRGVKYLTIASTVESIGDEAFSKNPEGMIGGPAETNLLSISFVTPSSLKSIGGSAFASSGIASITLPEGLEQVGNYALAGIDTVVLPQTITTIDALGLESVTDVTFQGKTRAEVLALGDFPWKNTWMDILIGVFHCTDGDIHLYRNITGPVVDTQTGENDRCFVGGGRISFTETEPIYCDFNNPDDGVFFVTFYGDSYRLSPDGMDTSKVEHTQFLVSLKDEMPELAEGEEMAVTLEVRTTYGISGGHVCVAKYPNIIMLYATN